MKPKFRPTLSLLFLAFSLYSSASTNPTFVKKIATRFSKQWNIAQQEKIYLHTDKPYYCAGENIWFKGYLINATTHLPKSLSQFMYVELIDKSDKVISRVKIKRDSLGFDGYIALKPEFTAGNYTLRAYTYWMQNAGTDFFFNKSIHIGNPIDDFVTSNISYGKVENGKVTATITFIDANKNKIPGKNIDVIESWNNPKRKKRSLLTENGKINLQITLDSTYKSKRVLEISINEPGYKYQNSFLLPTFDKDFDVQFFPESGTLLSNQQQIIAFKAIGTNGLSTEVNGKVYTDKDEEVAEFTSYNKGMGKFSLQVDSAVNYYAIVKSAVGFEKRIDLPKAQHRGVSMQLNFNRGKLWYEVTNKSTLANNALYLLIHSRGRMLAGLPLEETSGQIPESLLPEGIISLSVIDTLGNSYCERLYFERKNNATAISMKSDKPAYGKRAPVEMTFNIQTVDGKPCEGNYSISVVDGKTVKQDSLQDNITTNLLLSSDLKGHIEAPASYFSDSIKQDREKLDVLMLTQGWRRFSTAEVVKSKFKEPTYYLEAGQALSGKVVNVLKKPVKNIKVVMTSETLNRMKIVKTDSLGRYLVDGIEFPDSTAFSLKARKTKFYPDVEIIPDVDEFPTATALIESQSDEKQAIPNDYLFQTKEKYYTEGGMRVVSLDWVTVKGTKKKKNQNTEFYSGSEDKRITAENMKEYQGMPILNYLAMIPGINVNGEEVSLRGSSKNPLFFVNGIEARVMSDFTFFTTDEIENILIFNSAKGAIFGSRGGNGAIAIELKKGIDLAAQAESSLTSVSPLGYEIPAQFYVPKYEVDSIRLNAKADLRTTIYWNPKLKSDSTGTVQVKFYTADRAQNYSVVLEGISEKGEISRFVGNLKRKED